MNIASISTIPPAPVPQRGGPRFRPANLLRAVVQAVQSLWLHKLRSLLSVLGIVIGTSAVIALMAFGEGSMQDALDDIKRQGATNVIVRSVKPSDDSATASKSMVANYGIKFVDLERFGTFGDSVVRMVPMRIFPSEVRFGSRLHNSRLVCTTPEYADVNKLTMVRGRFLNDDENENRLNHCVLGSAAADKLFPFDDPLGHTVDIRSFKFIVIGVTAERMPTGGSGGSQAAEDYNNDVYISFKTGDARVGSKVFVRAAGSRSGEEVQVSQVTITLSDVDRVRPIGAEIKRMLETYHERKDWALTVPLDRLEEAERAKDRFKLLLVLIASISLFVGGIGIMNIMLATVTERTREIGIRRALGGKRKDITTQFLVEATVQTTVGGLLGVLFGLALVFLVPVGPDALAWIATTLSLSEWAAALSAIHIPAKVHVNSIFLSVGVSVAVGVLFGWYPAQRAAKMDPIEALRHT